jgi:hypothetical protein
MLGRSAALPIAKASLWSFFSPYKGFYMLCWYQLNIMPPFTEQPGSIVDDFY